MLNTLSKISVIVPVYNSESFLSECLDSITKQSFKDFELILIDDGSTDNSYSIIQEYRQKDSRIKVFSQENLGPSVARNLGLNYVSGDYVIFIDSDDWIDLDLFQNLYNAIKKYDADIACCSVIRKSKIKHKYRFMFKKVEKYTLLADKINVCRVPECCYVWGKLYKKDLVKNVLFNPGVFFEDMYWLPEVLKKSKNLVTVPNVNYYYRVNPNSIVKLLPSIKKQNDIYSAKKYIIKFFRENELYLPEKEKNITKKIFYLYKIPVLKIKEYNFVNTFLLFSFIPILKYRDFDSHYIFKFLGIKLRFRHKTNFILPELKEYGCEKITRSPRIIVSLTSFPKRINYVEKSIMTLLNQSLKPDKLILWLADTEFPNKEKDLPQSLLDLKQYGLEIEWCENLLSYKKIIPALNKYPNDIIVTADDDIYYDKNFLDGLYKSYLLAPQNIHVKRAIRMYVSAGKIMSYSRDIQMSLNLKKASFANQLMSGSGCLFPPNSLHSDVLDEKQFLKILPTHDDIYLWIMAIINGTKINVVGGYDEEMLIVDGTEKFGLCKINRKGSVGISPEEAFRRVVNQYPEVLNILKLEE